MSILMMIIKINTDGDDLTQFLLNFEGILSFLMKSTNQNFLIFISCMHVLNVSSLRSFYRKRIYLFPLLDEAHVRNNTPKTRSCKSKKLKNYF